MTFTWWLIPLIVLGIVLIFAPVLGKAWADYEEERRRWSSAMRPRRWRR